MSQCAIYDNRSLNFFRATCGFLGFIAFLTQSQWLVLITGFLVFFGMFSMKFNFLYQFHRLILKKITNEKPIPVEKDTGELKFVYGFTGACFLIAFVFIYYGKFVNIAWGLDVVVSFLTVLASFTNICVAAFTYVIFKKIFKK
jgi:hypothetical protein